MEKYGRSCGGRAAGGVSTAGFVQVDFQKSAAGAEVRRPTYLSYVRTYTGTGERTSTGRGLLPVHVVPVVRSSADNQPLSRQWGWGEVLKN